MFRKILIFIFAFIGILSTVLFLSNYFRHERAAKKFKKKCIEIKEGMSLQNAKLIMGDDYSKEFRSTIYMLQDINTSPEFYLDYPATFGSSTGTEIYFDPKTLNVTRVICGE